jgi:hypothetical protein
MEETDKEEYYPVGEKNNANNEERFEKTLELSNYINCSTMLE